MKFLAVTKEELSQLAEVESRVQLHPWSLEAFQSAFGSGKRFIQARNDAGHLLGFIVLMPVLDEMELLDISVDLPFQGQGVGLALMAEMTRYARQKCIKQILLEVRVSNTPAIRLYQRCGFEEVATRKNYYPTASDKREDALIMRLVFTDEDLG